MELTYDQIMKMSLNDFACSRCHATAGAPCKTPKGDDANGPHKARVDAYWAAAAAANKAEIAAATDRIESATDEEREEFAAWAEYKGLRPAANLDRYYDAENKGEAISAIDGLGYGPHSLDVANRFARTGSTQDAVMAQDGDGYWWLGFYPTTAAHDLAVSLQAAHALVFVVANTEAV